MIDEIKPVSRWREFGYDSPTAAARDWDNLQAAHWCCNAQKSNKISIESVSIRRPIVPDGEW
ncbi:MAG: hypothetical protein IKG62_04955 [Lachnospiraceae bacterium]|nr:hypothetical protein [Lachnospiraceae bacterium]